MSCQPSAGPACRGTVARHAVESWPGITWNGGPTWRGIRKVETWSETDRIGDEKSIDLVQETWDEEEWARRLKLAALHPMGLPPEERAFWLGILRDPDNFVRSDIPDDIDIEDGDPTTVEELLFGPPALKLRPLRRAAIRQKWEDFRGREQTAGESD